jgi:hypothetical protein
MATHSPIDWFYRQQSWRDTIAWADAAIRVREEDAAKERGS